MSEMLRRALGSGAEGQLSPKSPETNRRRSPALREMRFDFASGMIVPSEALRCATWGESCAWVLTAGRGASPVVQRALGNDALRESRPWEIDVRRLACMLGRTSGVGRLGSEAAMAEHELRAVALVISPLWTDETRVG